MFLNKCQFRQSKRGSLRFSVRNHFFLSHWLISIYDSLRVISSRWLSPWTIYRINFSIDQKSMERVLTTQILKLEKQNIRENDQKIKIRKLNQSLTEKLEAAITRSERRYDSYYRVYLGWSATILRAVVSHCSKFDFIDNVTKESTFDSEQISLFHFYAQGKTILIKKLYVFCFRLLLISRFKWWKWVIFDWIDPGKVIYWQTIYLFV